MRAPLPGEIHLTPMDSGAVEFSCDCGMRIEIAVPNWLFEDLVNHVSKHNSTTGNSWRLRGNLNGQPLLDVHPAILGLPPADDDE